VKKAEFLNEFLSQSGWARRPRAPPASFRRPADLDGNDERVARGRGQSRNPGAFYGKPGRSGVAETPLPIDELSHTSVRDN
jgi:hypothetical protein